VEGFSLIPGKLGILIFDGLIKDSKVFSGDLLLECNLVKMASGLRVTKRAHVRKK